MTLSIRRVVPSLTAIDAITALPGGNLEGEVRGLLLFNVVTPADPNPEPEPERSVLTQQPNPDPELATLTLTCVVEEDALQLGRGFATGGAVGSHMEVWVR